MSKFKRILLIPIGFFKKLIELANEGARDIENKFRFKGAIIDSGCCFNINTSIDPHTHILKNCIINNSKIASYTYIGENCLIQNTVIGKFCSIANEVLIGLGNHPQNFFTTSPLFYRKINPLKIKIIKDDLDFVEYKPINIGNDVWIGTRAIILDGVKIGNGAVVAANSVVTKDIPPYAIVAGTPAKIIKYRMTDKNQLLLLESKWWEKNLNNIVLESNSLNKLLTN